MQPGSVERNTSNSSASSPRLATTTCSADNPVRRAIFSTSPLNRNGGTIGPSERILVQQFLFRGQFVQKSISPSEQAGGPSRKEICSSAFLNVMRALDSIHTDQHSQL